MLEQNRIIIAGVIADAVGIEQNQVLELLTKPPKPDMGDYAFPCFSLAKTMRKAPPAIATELEPIVKNKLSDAKVITEASGPYLNFRLNKQQVIDQVIRQVLHEKKLLPEEGKGKTVVIDFSSPNIAKPFSMGHLRATTIGNALSRIYNGLGYKVVRINHLGDWGTQFGKLIVAYKMWGDDKALQDDEIDYLMQIYVKFNEEAKKDPDLDDQARAAFKQLEDGDEEATALWKKFREISLQEFERLYKLLNVEFDSYNGESFYLDKVDKTVGSIIDAGILEESEGAQVVSMGEDDPPCMIRKSDGATTYAARDLAAIFYRKETYNFDKLIYVVGAPQALHFKQVFSVLKKMGLDYYKNCEHVPFGQVLIGGEMMSTRKGNVIFLEDVIDKTAELALTKIAEDAGMQPDELDKDAVKRARAIAVSSIIFFDLKNGRVKDVDFNWNEILNPKGETGIYLQYAHARIHGITRKFETKMGKSSEEILKDIPSSSEENAYSIAAEIARFPEKVRYAAETNEPSQVSRYLLDLSSSFSTYYRANKVVDPDNPKLSTERLAVVLAVRDVLAAGLRLLGIEPLNRM